MFAFGRPVKFELCRTNNNKVQELLFFMDLSLKKTGYLCFGIFLFCGAFTGAYSTICNGGKAVADFQMRLVRI